MISRQFCFERENFPFEKKTGPVRFEPETFAVPGVTSRPSVPETQKKCELIIN